MLLNEYTNPINKKLKVRLKYNRSLLLWLNVFNYLNLFQNHGRLLSSFNGVNILLKSLLKY